MKKSIKKMILEFFNMYYNDYPFLPFSIIENFVLINKIHQYLIDNNKYCTDETVSRKWREIRETSETKLINNRHYKIIKYDNKELYAISKIKTNSIYDTWEFTKL